MFLISDVFKNGITNKTKIDPPIAIIPADLICTSTKSKLFVRTQTRSVMPKTSLRVTPKKRLKKLYGLFSSSKLYVFIRLKNNLSIKIG